MAVVQQRPATTFALEIAGDFSLAHGEAVAIGLIYAAHLGHELGRISSARVQQHYDVVGGLYELNTSLPDFDHQLLLGLMGRDKKALDGLTFVLDGDNGVEVVAGVPDDAVLNALRSMSEA